MPGDEQCSEDRPTLPISIFCSNDTNGPCLKLRVRPVPLSSQTHPGVQHSLGFAFASFDDPSGEEIIHPWMVQQIMTDGSQDFEPEMDKLLVHFVRASANSTEPAGQKLNALLTKLLRMRCLWKLWSCKQMFAQTHLSPRAVPFDSRHASIQDCLRFVAARAIWRLEHDILGQIENYPSKTTNELVMKWFLLWQLFLIYRQSLDLTLGQEATNSALISYPGQLIVVNTLDSC
jgi:hypothetical protein